MKLFLPLAGWLAIVALVTTAPKPEHRAEFRYGLPSSSIMERDRYVMEYDPRTRQPRWVLEYIDKDVLKIEPRPLVFAADKELPKEWRVPTNEFRNTGYDRGHLVPIADGGDGLMSSVSPMLPGFNRGPWAQLERTIREQVGATYRKAWVVTVPLFHPPVSAQSATIPYARSVPVPTHFAKAVLLESWACDERDMRAWIVPHRLGVIEFDDYACTVDHFERVAGVDVFAGLDDKIESQLEGQRP